MCQLKIDKIDAGDQQYKNSNAGKDVRINWFAGIFKFAQAIFSIKMYGSKWL